MRQQFQPIHVVGRAADDVAVAQQPASLYPKLIFQDRCSDRLGSALRDGRREEATGGFSAPAGGNWVHIFVRPQSRIVRRMTPRTTPLEELRPVHEAAGKTRKLNGEGVGESTV
jgi:hypothetical protein